MNLSYLQIFCVCIATLSSACPQQYGTTPTSTLQQFQDSPKPDGNYLYSYQSANGLAAKERDYLKSPTNPEREAQVSQGSYQYTSKDGVVMTVQYVPDKNDFLAPGSAISTPPPNPT